MKTRLSIVALTLAALSGAQAATPPCPIANERPMIEATLFFGLDIHGRGPVTAREWRRFAAEVLTRQFPDGFTVSAGEGQWRDPHTGVVVREKSKVLLVGGPDNQDFVHAISVAADAYKRRFHQLSVGILTQRACGAF